MASKSNDSLVVGVDVGTGSLRTVLYNLAGEQVAEDRYALNNRFLAGGGVEQDALEWRAGLAKTFNTCRKKAGVKPGAIKAVGFDGTSGTVVPIDSQGFPLGPALLWMDTRSSGEADEINSTGDAILGFAGGRTSAEWVLAKILWLKRNFPEIYQQAWQFMEPPDYLSFLTSGEVASSYSNAVHKRHYAHSGGGWPVRLLDRIDLSSLMGKWPTRLCYPWETVGQVTPAAAAEFGLPAGIPVVNGGNDGPIALLGLGIIEPGNVCMTVGSSTCFLFLHHLPHAIPGFWGPYPDGVIPGCNLFDVGQVSTGSIIEWFKKLLFAGFGRSGNTSGFAELEIAAQNLPPGAKGLSAFDAWQGNRTPHNDSRIRGALWGLSLEHGPEHIYRAILEATAFGARQIFEVMATHSLSADKIIACGGGSRNPLWMQIYADVLEHDITLTQTSEAAALGSAIGGAVAAGLFPDIQSATTAMVKYSGSIAAGQDSFAPYAEAYQNYKKAYPCLKSLAESQ
ncbi:MAG: carbohydrate kinase [Planctomycetota bacterium]|jgi:ribulokinase|nr:carbohydrate kinase [Planctomycetota bacterium]